MSVTKMGVGGGPLKTCLWYFLTPTKFTGVVDLVLKKKKKKKLLLTRFERQTFLSLVYRFLRPTETPHATIGDYFDLY